MRKTTVVIAMLLLLSFAAGASFGAVIDVGPWWDDIKDEAAAAAGDMHAYVTAQGGTDTCVTVFVETTNPSGKPRAGGVFYCD